MFGSMGQTNVKNLGNGGTMDGDVTITGDLTVSGGISLSLNEVLQGTSTIDINSTEALLVRKDSDGGDVFIVDTTNSRVGVGVTPTKALSVKGASGQIANITNGSNNLVMYVDNSNVQIANNTDLSGAEKINMSTANEAIEFYQGGSEKMTLTSTGLNIAGTATVTGALIDLRASADTDSEIIFREGSTAKAVILNDASANSLSLSDGSGNLSPVVNIVSGNVGIGGTPSNQLTVVGDDAIKNISIYTNSDSAVTSDTGARIFTTGDGGSGIYAENGHLVIQGRPAGRDIIFLTNTDASEKARITAGGDVTIGGVTATESKLHIKQTSTNYALRIQNSTNTTNSYNGIMIAGVDENTTSYPLFIKGNSDTLDESAGNVKFVVRADGNTGVGTASPSEALEVNSSGANLKVVSDANVYLSLDSTQTNGDEWQIFNANSGSTSTLQFKNIDQSALVMLMTEAGDVHIGGSNPTKKLEVAGDIKLLNGTNNITVFYGGDNWGQRVIYNTGNMDFFLNGENRFVLDTSSRISLSNNDGGASNTVFGKLAGNALASGGNYNLLIGEDAGNDLTTSDHNVAIGFQAFAKATASADNNTVVGNYAMGSIVSNDVNDCVVLGYNAIGIGVMEAGASGVVAVGRDALKSLTSGDGNVALGFESAKSMTTGARNVVIGYQAGDAMTIATRSVAIGYGALSTEDVGDRSIAIGFNSLFSQNSDSNNETTGNVGIGVEAGFYNQTGQYNTLIGSGAGQGASGQNHSQNTAVGYASLNVVTTGGNNVAMGMSSLRALTSGTENVSIGKDSMYDANTASGVVAVGAESAYNITSGSESVAIGKQALYTATTVGGNTAVGYQALKLNTVAGNTAVGHSALLNNSSGINVAVGYQSGTTITTGTQNTLVGYQAGNDITEGGRNTAVGHLAFGGALDANGDESFDNTFIGFGSGAGNWVTAVSNKNTAVGAYTMQGAMNGSLENVAVGYEALKDLTEGDSNVAIGTQALQNVTTAVQNVAVGSGAGNDITVAGECAILGHNAGSAITDHGRSVFVGHNAGANQEGEQNVFIGKDAGLGSSGSDNDGTVAIGFDSLKVLTSGSNNTAVGFKSADGVSTGYDNTALGYNALGALQTGNSNVAIGKNALDGSDNGARNVAIGNGANGVQVTTHDCVTIGHEAEVSANGASNQIAIGKGATGQADNSVTLGNADVTAVYMASDSGATVHAGAVDIENTGISTTSDLTGASFNFAKTGGATSSSNTFRAVFGKMDFNDADEEFGNLIGGDFTALVTTNNTSAGGDNIIALTSLGKLTTGNANNIFGTANYAQIDAGTIDQSIYGNYTNVDANDGRVVQDVYGAFIDVDIESPCEVDRDVYGLKVKVDDDDASAGNAYGIEVECLSNVDASINLIGGGIKFPATQASSSDANVLDDYEEGTFTPVWSAGSGTLGTINYTSQIGRYTKIGDVVHFSISFYNGAFAVGSGSGQARISGLPFTSNSTNGKSACSVGISQYFTGQHPSTAEVLNNQTSVDLLYRDSADGATALLQVSDLQAGSSGVFNLINISGTYFV